MRRIVFAALATSAVAVALLVPRLATATVSGPARDTCIKTFQRQRACTRQFIPALVDLRISVGKPHFMVEEAAKPGGRDALIEQALTEWKDDSTDASIAQTCSRMQAFRSPETVSAAESCLQASDCDGFVQCVMPLIKQNQ
jgi:hypothetical protein